VHPAQPIDAAGQPGSRFAKWQTFDPPDEVDDIAVGVAPEAHPTAGIRIGRQVRTAAVGVERTSTSECAAGAAKLNSVVRDQINNRMLLTQQVSVDAGCAGRHHRWTDQREASNAILLVDFSNWSEGRARIRLWRL
jgi:hypothetical protein